MTNLVYTRDNAPYLSLDEIVDWLVGKAVALLGIDAQNAFCPNGRLATANGHLVMPYLNRLAALPYWKLRQLSRDYHPHWHVSYIEIRRDLMADADKRNNLYFLSLNEVTSWTERDNPLDPEAVAAGITVPKLKAYLEDVAGNVQILWPAGRHAEQSSTDSDFHPELNYGLWQGVTIKGDLPEEDSYSAFKNNGRNGRKTDLISVLQRNKVEANIVAGLCLHYCVNYSAIDSVNAGYPTMVALDASQPVFETDMSDAIKNLVDAGVKLARTEDIEKASAILMSA